MKSCDNNDTENLNESFTYEEDVDIKSSQSDEELLTEIGICCKINRIKYYNTDSLP